MFRRGSRGNGVKTIQRQLVALGYDIGPTGVDGIFGPRTEAAVRKFQGDQRIRVDGIWGPQTTGAAAQARTGSEPSAAPPHPFGEAPDRRAPTVSRGGTVIPRGMRLVQVRNATGTDAGETFYLVGTVFGVDVAYLIGDRKAVEELFGSVANIPETQVFRSQSVFDNSGIVVTGNVDEIVGAEETLQAQFERDLRELGLDNPPAWIAADPEAMTKFLIGVNEGWSPERVWGELATTDAFQARFPGLDVVQAQLGTNSYVESVAAYQAREAEIRASLVRHRGPNTNTDEAYVSSLVASGWQPAEVEELVDLERQIRDNPEALANINDILEFQGLQALSPDDFIDFLRYRNHQATGGQPRGDRPTVRDSGGGSGGGVDDLPLEVSRHVSDTTGAPISPVNATFEAINDALRMQALINEGFDVSPEFATALGEGSSTEIGSISGFSEAAQMAAKLVTVNRYAINLEQYGLTREDIIAASFNDPDATGKSVQEVNDILERLGRERKRSATGLPGTASFQDAEGRLRTQGFGSV